MTSVARTAARDPQVNMDQSSSHQIRPQEHPDQTASSAEPRPDLPATQPISILHAGRPALQYSSGLHALSNIDTTRHGPPTIGVDHSTPLSAELRVRTNLAKHMNPEAKEHEFGKYPQSPPATISPDYYNYRAYISSNGLPVRTSSVKSLAASTRSLSPSSAMSSPGFGPLSEITPLPSPLGSKQGSWLDLSAAMNGAPATQLVPHNGSPTGASPPRKRKAYAGIAPNTVTEQPGGSLDATLSRARSQSNRSLSDYLPPPAIARPRNVAVSGAQASAVEASKPLQREEHVASQRGIAAKPPQSARPPTPPRSNRSAADSSESEGMSGDSPQSKPVPMSYEATTVSSGQTRRWTGVRQLGVGTFSTVMLATSDPRPVGKTERNLNPRTLVAVKVCEHGPAGGADERKIESSLKRELEILRAVSHPSLVHLRAVRVTEKRTFLVLNYSAGGDLFELASLKLDLLVPALIRRIFTELVHAVAYLHKENIVHRDIKLENVLVNPRLSELPELDYATHPHPIITLTDLGLGRYIPHPPLPPTLDRPCGSEDYAAPELLMGQGYDGRQTDAWALGVLLYALMEGRLPFDPIPGKRRQSPTKHRIARCEWQWTRWGDADGDWDAGETTSKGGAVDAQEFRQWGAQLDGACKVVEGLLMRVSRRWSLDKVSETEWVSGGLSVDGALKREDWEEEE